MQLWFSCHVYDNSSFSAVNNSLRKNAENWNCHSSEPQAVGFSEQSSPFHHQAHGVCLPLGRVRDPSWQQKHLEFETKSSGMHSEEDSPEIKLIAQACCASLFLISRERWELEQKNSFQEGLVQLSISTSISLLCIKYFLFLFWKMTK